MNPHKISLIMLMWCTSTQSMSIATDLQIVGAVLVVGGMIKHSLSPDPASSEKFSILHDISAQNNGSPAHLLSGNISLATCLTLMAGSAALGLGFGIDFGRWSLTPKG